MNEYLLEVKQLSKCYGKQRHSYALKNVSMQLMPGVYGLLGPNGAGKSTLIHILVGALQQTEGYVLWHTTPIDRLGIQYRRILGYMPQQQGFYPQYTGRRFLAYMCALKEIPSKEVSAQVQRVSEAVALQEQLDKKISAYSGGMKQRLLLASALIGSPRILILDEPTAGLDPKERVRLRDFLNNLSKDMIILVATHVVSDIESIAKEIILLKNGELIAKASVSDLVEKYAPKQNLEAVYLTLFGKEGGLYAID